MFLFAVDGMLILVFATFLALGCIYVLRSMLSIVQLNCKSCSALQLCLMCNGEAQDIINAQFRHSF